MRPSILPVTARALLCGLAVTLCFSAFLHAAPNTRLQLQRRKATIQQKIRSVRSNIHYVRKQATQTKSNLVAMNHRLLQARGELVAATLQLKRKKIELQRATVQLQEAQRAFTQGQREARARVAAMYQRGEPGYLELLLSSDDFGDMLQRAQLASYLQEQDTSVLTDLKERRATLEQYQERVADKTREVSAWQTRVAILHERTVEKRQHVAEKLTSQRGQLEQLEAELSALERDSNEITSMLRRLMQSSAGKRRYHRVYAGGPVGGLPVNGRIGSGFGMRYHPILRRYRMHTGVDIGAPSGTPIYAAGGGEVIFAGWRGGYGNCIIIDHGGGRATLYGHMSGYAVGTGAIVTRKTVIGYVGSTGLSTGPHLHYELRINGTPVNPL